MEPTPSRLEIARRRLRTARHAVAAGAAALFVAVLLAARGSHPATTSASTGTSSVSPGTQQVEPDDSSGFDFSGGSFGGSSGSAPQVQSGGS